MNAAIAIIFLFILLGIVLFLEIRFFKMVEFYHGDIDEDIVNKPRKEIERTNNLNKK